MPLLLEIFGNICTVITCFPDFEVINVEIILSFLNKPFSYITKKSERKFKYLQNEKGLLVEVKSTFHHFKKVFSCQKGFKLSQT